MNFTFLYVTELQLHKILQTQTKTSDVNDMTEISSVLNITL